MNQEFKDLIDKAIVLLDSAIDEIETDNLGNDKTYIRLSNIISQLEGIVSL